LSTIQIAATKLTRCDPNSPDGRRTYDRLRRAISHMTTLIDELVAFARIGNAPLQRTAVDLSAMAQDLASDLQRSVPDRNINLLIEPGIHCVADRDLMRVALQNLLANAWKYTSKVEHPRVEVATTTTAGRRILFIRDNGAGFDMKDAHRLFAPFQRLHAESEFAGTGLGLASVHRVLERHACAVWADSAPGKGATFFLELPRAATEGRPAAGPVTFDAVAEGTAP
jgi:light-regulated signal transduction histidine kinase (bacteriophytochrome)